MPSIFSRSRTTSAPNKNSPLHSLEDSGVLDEFGRVASRLSNHSPSPVSKKDKKRAKEHEKRLGVLSTTRERAEYEKGGVELPLSPIPDGTFLPLNLERPRNDLGAIQQFNEHDYGYLSYERHVVLGLEQVARLVEVVSEELGTRGGIATPFIFSTTALDISSSAIKRLIRSFLNTCSINPGHAAEEAEMRWREEARFAEPHELGMCLRWGLARVVRMIGGRDVRGLIAWDHYADFRESEAALGYPPSHFATFLPDLPPPLQLILLTVLTLLTRLTANSTTSGHTPPTLSPLFGPLLFGLGPATLAFHPTYIHYLRAANAMEHILLAFIRWQDGPLLANATSHLNSSGSAAALGVPTRLKEWIKGYPAMLPHLQERNKKDKPQARRGARTVRVMSVRRNVRMYSPDLVKSAATWAYRTRPGVNENGLAASKEWDRIAPSTLKLPPRYSEAYKKRMDMPANFHPDTGPGASLASPAMSAAPSASSYSSNTSSGTSASLLANQDYFGLGLGGREGEDRFRSLTDLKWGEFESMGFSGLGDENKLQFDLTESARSERSAKRTTLSWNDFSSSGFSRTDEPLSATLQFSSPVSKTISSWPAHNAEMSKKLKKTHKALPAFGWDTEPVVGNEEVIEEAFIDVFCDLVYGGGWMDLERGEQLDRDCNWALIEFKCMPPSRTTTSGGSDPRTAVTLILFEEFVPLEYRQQLAVTSSTRRRLPSLFSQSGRSKQWKQAATLNGRPYVVGHVPRSPSYREVEFEGLLRGGSATKVISLGSKGSVRAPPSRALSTASTAAPGIPTASRTISSPLYVRSPEFPPAPKSEDMHSDSTVSPSIKKASRFRLPGGIPVPSPGGGRKAGVAPAQYSSVDFETRLASYSDDEFSGGVPEPEAAKQKRRESKDDAWVDILVGSQSRRLGGQDAELKDGERRRGIRGRRSDPELASLEVAQVLAAVRDRPLSATSVNDRVDHDHGMDQVYDMSVDEVETVPRTSGVHSTIGSDAVEYPSEFDVELEEVEDPHDRPALTPSQMARQQRRMGYFDLHPERRPVLSDPIDDDPRDRLAYDEDSGNETDNGDLYGSPEKTPAPVRKLPTPPQSTRILQDSPEAPGSDVAGDTELKYEVFPTPLQPTAHRNGNGDGGYGTKPLTPSKTAALIEMYRERERGAPSKPSGVVQMPIPIVVASLQPSRLPLPVRSASLPKEGAMPLVPPAQTIVTISPQPSPRLSPPLEDERIEPLRVPIDESGRASPARYVHGAPLHNVLEEEEEEG